MSISPIILLLVGKEKKNLLEQLNANLDSSITYSLNQQSSLSILEVNPTVDIPKEKLLLQLQILFAHNIIAVNQTNLSIIVGEFLKRRNETISTAESCTAGKIASWLADIPGSSSYLMEGVIVYSNQSKNRLCGVPIELIEQYGAVSAQVAKALSEGILSRANTDWAVSVTGIAGPTGGSPEKPVGTVHISCSSRYNTKERRFLFSGNRQEVRAQTATQALVLLLESILSLEVHRYSS